MFIERAPWEKIIHNMIFYVGFVEFILKVIAYFLINFKIVSAVGFGLVTPAFAEIKKRRLIPQND